MLSVRAIPLLFVLLVFFFKAHQKPPGLLIHVHEDQPEQHCFKTQSSTAAIDGYCTKRIPFTSHTFQNVINFERANDLEFPFELHSECIFNVDLFRQKKCMDN